MLRGASLGLVLGCGCGDAVPPAATAAPQTTVDAPQPYAPTAEPVRWWKGNPHVHSLWSTGEAPPEAVVDWYRSAGYQFLALTERNTLPEGERWAPLTWRQEHYLEALGWKFGQRDWREWSKLRDEGAGGQSLRLMELDELRERFETPGEFLLLDGQELGDGTGFHPVDIVVLGAERLIEPRYGLDPLERASRDLEGVFAQAKTQLGRPMLAFLAHPNWGWTFTSGALAALRGTRFVEILSGAEQACSGGDDAHPSVETLWDAANAERARSGLPLLLALAGEDEFLLRTQGQFESAPEHPGSPWIAVRSETLTPHELVLAMADGDVYVSTAVVLDEVRFDGSELRIDIHPERSPPLESTSSPVDQRYVTRFIGASRERPLEGARVLLETTDNPAIYRLTGDELFVRAKVFAGDVLHAGESDCAWTQPVQPPRAER